MHGHIFITYFSIKIIIFLNHMINSFPPMTIHTKNNVKICRICFFHSYMILLSLVETLQRKIVHNTGFSC